MEILCVLKWLEFSELWNSRQSKHYKILVLFYIYKSFCRSKFSPYLGMVSSEWITIMFYTNGGVLPVLTSFMTQDTGIYEMCPLLLYCTISYNAYKITCLHDTKSYFAVCVITPSFSFFLFNSAFITGTLCKYS